MGASAPVSVILSILALLAKKLKKSQDFLVVCNEIHGWVNTSFVAVSVNSGVCHLNFFNSNPHTVTGF